MVDQGVTVVFEFLETRDLIPTELISGADPYMILYLGRNKKKVRPARKDFAIFEGAKYTFALAKDASKEEVRLDFYYKNKTQIGSACMPLKMLLPFNTEHDMWLAVQDEKQEKKGEVHTRMYMFLKREKSRSARKYKTPLFQAVEECDLQLLMKCNDDSHLDPNVTDESHWTALHYACSKWENEYIITLLLRNPRVRVDIENADGNTALHTFCTSYKNPKCQDPFHLLLQHGADVNAKNSQGETPLHKAVMNPRIRMILVELLLAAGAKVNEKAARGGTPLHYAVQTGRSDLVTILVANGADLNSTDGEGRTPLDLCKVFRNEAVLRKMQEFIKLGEFLDRLGAGELKKQFFQKQLFKYKLKGMNEAQLRKHGIEVSAGQSLKMLAAFKEISDVDPNKELLDSASDGKDLPTTPEQMRRVLDDMISKNDLNIDEADIEFLQLLGTGSAGEVYKGIYTRRIAEAGGKTTKIQLAVAIKVLKLSADSELEAFKKEFDVISGLRSDYIVALYGAVKSDKLKMVMELCTRGSLHDILNSKNWYLGWTEFFVFAEQMFRGLIAVHTHSPQILHRDLKSLNILVTEDWVCKLCDFGLARFNTGTNMETLGKLRGTYAYTAPEVYSGATYSDKSDIYSMGILLWEMVYRIINQKYQRPYEEYPQLRQDFQIIHKTATENLRPTIPASTPVALSTLISQMIVKDQANRPNAKEVLQELLSLKSDYKHARAEWDAAILGTPIGQPIVFPASSIPEAVPSTTPTVSPSPPSATPALSSMDGTESSSSSSLHEEKEASGRSK